MTIGAHDRPEPEAPSKKEYPAVGPRPKTPTKNLSAKALRDATKALRKGIKNG
jgi:hypothetical protein